LKCRRCCLGHLLAEQSEAMPPVPLRLFPITSPRIKITRTSTTMVVTRVGTRFFGEPFLARIEFSWVLPSEVTDLLGVTEIRPLERDVIIHVIERGWCGRRLAALLAFAL